MSGFFAFFEPWEFSWLVQLSVWASLLLYFNGLRKSAPEQRPGYAPIAAFVIGVVLMYLVTQTYYDYLSQYMFFVHRVQHLVLHHMGPFLVALAAPAPVLARGIPRPVRAWFGRRRVLAAACTGLYRVLQQPLVASILFAGLIIFWLSPRVHFDAMISRPLYWVMNWSMALDGLLFWWLIFNREAGGITPRLGYGTRLLMLVAVMLPQIIVGASITFAGSNWFEVYAVCGRAWPLDPMTDQQIGGVITWVPAAMMSSVAGVIVIWFWLREDPLLRKRRLSRTRTLPAGSHQNKSGG